MLRTPEVKAWIKVGVDEKDEVVRVEFGELSERKRSWTAKGDRMFFSLVRNGLPNNLGFDITTDAEIRSDAFLFGESMGRFIVTVPEEKEDEFVDYLFERKIPVMTLGHVTKGEIRIDDKSFGFIDKGIVSEV